MGRYTQFRTLLISLLPVAIAEVRALAPAAFASYKTKSSTLVYYGPRSETVSGATVFLQGSDICEPFEVAVRGFIVVSDRRDALCDLEQVYRKLYDAGALAYIDLVPFFPPGHVAYRHQTWEPCAYCEHTMTMVLVCSDGRGTNRAGLDILGDSTVYDLWSSTDGLVLEVSPPHDRTMEEYYSSIQWVLAMRIVMPLFAVWTSVHASLELHRQRNSIKGHAGWAICVLEAPTCALVAVMLACGQYGPMDVLPLTVHLFAYSLFSGISFVTTLILALFMREESRSFRTSLPRRLVLVQYRWRLGMLALLVLAIDAAFATAVPISPLVSIFVAIMGVIVFILCTVYISFMFFSFSWNHREAVGLYLRPRVSPDPGTPQIRSESFLQLGRLMFWVSVSAVCMFVASAMLIIALLLAMVISVHESSGDPWFYCVLTFTCARIGVSYAQVRWPKYCSAPRLFIELLYLFGVREHCLISFVLNFPDSSYQGEVN